MVCHDMHGGYKEDRYVNGTKTVNEHLYRFNYWPCIEYFIYFSHDRIALPPVAYTNLAH